MRALKNSCGNKSVVQLYFIHPSLIIKHFTTSYPQLWYLTTVLVTLGITCMFLRNDKCWIFCFYFVSRISLAGPDLLISHAWNIFDNIIWHLYHEKIQTLPGSSLNFSSCCCLFQTKHCKILVSCSNREISNYIFNWMQAHGTACRLMELNAS